MTATGYRLDGAGFHYPAQAAWALRDVALTIAPGEFVGVIGPNGSGKSTLLKLLAGFLAPHQGQVFLDGQPLGRYPARALAQRIAVVPQSTHFVFPFTVQEIVEMGRVAQRAARAGRLGMLGWPGETVEDRAIVSRALEQLELAPLAPRSILELSGGERQKALVARALAQQPSILLLDEPTAFLDLHHQASVWRLVQALHREQGVTVVAVSHDLNLAALFCQRLVLLDQGRVRRAGPPGEVLTQSELDALYGQAVLVDRHPLAAVPRVTVRP
jgi:iron complex transport system ATP-binding protein